VRTRFVAFAASALLLVGWCEPAQAEDCAAPAGAPSSAESELEFERATACLINEERAGSGRVRVERSARLDRAADHQARDMVARHYFAHVSPEGEDLLDRVRATRYLRGWPGFRLGEVLAWGTGDLASPAATMRAWLASPGHRRVIRGRAYRDVGVAVVAGVPSGDVAGATYSVVFGRREAR
jgi:uncharacterized protein YkwD